MEDVVIFGKTDFSELVGYYIRQDKRYHLLGYTISQKYISEQGVSHQDRPIPFGDLRKYFPNIHFKILLTVGYRQMNEYRHKLAMYIKSEGYELTSYISLQAEVAAKCLGEGTIILPGCVIQPFVRVGDGNIFESGCIICHHTTIGDYNFFAPAVSIAGQVQIGNNCFLGNNCTVKNGINIGNQVLIGAGAYIANDIEADKVIVPARSIELSQCSSDITI